MEPGRIKFTESSKPKAIEPKAIQVSNPAGFNICVSQLSEKNESVEKRIRQILLQPSEEAMSDWMDKACYEAANFSEVLSGLQINVSDSILEIDTIFKDLTTKQNWFIAWWFGKRIDRNYLITAKQKLEHPKNNIKLTLDNLSGIYGLETQINQSLLRINKNLLAVTAVTNALHKDDNLWAMRVMRLRTIGINLELLTRQIEAFKKQLETTLFTAQNIEITLIPNLLLLVKE